MFIVLCDGVSCLSVLVLCCVVLCCVVLCCVVLCCVVLCRVAFCCVVLEYYSVQCLLLSRLTAAAFRVGRLSFVMTPAGKQSLRVGRPPLLRFTPVHSFPFPGHSGDGFLWDELLERADMVIKTESYNASH